MKENLIETVEEILRKHGVSESYAGSFLFIEKPYCVCLPPLNLGKSVCKNCGRVRRAFEILEGENDEPTD